MNQTISIVVPVRNNEGSLPALLNSIGSQNTPAAETIVVDGSSSDKSPEIATAHGAKLIEYPCDRDMRGYARNLGAQHASGAAFLFLDSDMELTPPVITECAEAIADGADAVLIPEVTLGRGLLGSVRRWERGLVQRYTSLTFARCIKRESFWGVHGFDESILGFEDLDLQATMIEANLRIDRSVSPIVHHEESQQLFSYLKKRHYYQGSARAYKAKHPFIAASVFSPIERLRIYTSGVRKPSEIPLMIMATSFRVAELV